VKPSDALDSVLRELAQASGVLEQRELLRELGEDARAEDLAVDNDRHLERVERRLDELQGVVVDTTHAAVVQAALRPLEPDYAATVAFLRWFAPAGPWLLVGIDPEKEKETVARAFSVAEEQKLRAWLEREGAWRNLYFTVNPTRWDAPKQKKPARQDMAALAWLHVDLDPDKEKPFAQERARILGALRDLPDGIPPPSCVIDSGGGYQAFWRLDTPLELAGADAAARTASADAAAAWNRWLEQRLGADRTHNLDRLMRLPGTLNRPDKKKRDAGRAVALAQVVEQRDTLHALESFQRAEAKGGAAVKREATARGRGFWDCAETPPPLDELWPEPQWVESLDSVEQIRGNAELRALLETGGTHADRSKNVMHAAGWMARVGVPEGVQVALLQDARLGISAHVLAQADPDRAAWRAVEQARQDEAGKRARDAAAQAAGELLLGENGKPKKSRGNLRAALQKLGVELWYDELAERHMVAGLGKHGQQLDDAGMRALDDLLDEQYGLAFNWETLVRYLLTVAEKKKRHPVREYLAALRWDGVPRVDAWLSTYMGVEPSSYAREVGRCVLLAAVARMREPGCKFDQMMILEGSQGVEKSKALRSLVANPTWFSDSVSLAGDDRRFMEAVAGKWIVEANELAGMNRSDVETLKATLSRQVDRARLAYARLPVDRPRQCILIGTTNANEYLRDSTGNRRFWPVKVGELRLDELARDRDQLWAEAAHRQSAGEEFVMKREVWKEAGEEQEARQARDPYLDALEAALGEFDNGRITVRDAWALVGADPGRATQDDNVRLGEAMRALGWRRAKMRFGESNPRRCYAIGDGSKRVSVEGLPSGVAVLVDGQRVRTG
jgi:hypothetical protein